MEAVLRKHFEWKDGPHVGRWGKSVRKMYMLHPKAKGTPTLILKRIDLKTEEDATAFRHESAVNAKCTQTFPTKFLKAWVEEGKGNMLSKYMDNVSWDSLPSDKVMETAVWSAAKQLQHIHDCGFVQCDLAMINVLVDVTGRTAIIDFEDAKEATPERIADEWRHFKAMFQTLPSYGIPPEDEIKYWKLFNFAQHAAPNDGFVLERRPLHDDESKNAQAYVLLRDGKPMTRVVVQYHDSGALKGYTSVDTVEKTLVPDTWQRLSALLYDIAFTPLCVRMSGRWTRFDGKTWSFM